MEIFSRTPEKLTAGDSYSWRIEAELYPANDGWQLTYYLVMAGQYITFAASADGIAHLIEISAATTAAWQPGNHNYRASVAKAPERFTIESGSILIQPDYAGATGGLDDRHFVKKVLDALEALILGKASKDQLQISIGDRSLSMLSPQQLTEWYDIYRAKWSALKMRERIANGQPIGRTIKTRFS